MGQIDRIDQLERENAALRDRLAAVHGGISTADDEAVTRVLSDRAMLENLPDIITVMNRQHRLLYLNRTVPNRRLEDVIGTNALDYIAPDHREAYLRAYELAWATGVPQQLELHTTSDFDWETSLVPIKQAGRVVYMLGTIANITERKRAERALSESESRLRLALEATGMGIWVWDQKSGDILWDAALSRIFGLEPSALPRRYDDYLARLHPDDRARVDAALQRALETQSFDDLEHRVLRADGDVRYVLSKADVFHDSAGVVSGLRGGIIDITERKRLEDQLREVQKMEAVGRLTAGIAHNFNNMLSVIIPNVGLCRADAQTGSELATRLADVELAATQAAEMVRQLMLFARGATGLRKVTVDLVAVTKRTIEICRTTFERKIALALELAERVPAVSFVSGQFEQVLLNICINARDAFEQAQTAEPRIAVRLDQAESGNARIRITDNGPGMDEATRLRVFEPFFTTKDVGRGTGLGLSSAYAIVVDHQGVIRCESRPGQGTSFEIELPSTASAPSAPPNRPGTPERPASGTVLLVDDEPLVRRAVRALLERAGYRVLDCDGGRGALRLLEVGSEQVDAILLDRSMPGMSGDDVLARLAARGGHPPIVLMSGQLGDAAEHRAAAAVLSKPVDRATLLETLREVMKR